jgi:hypothetical protein
MIRRHESHAASGKLKAGQRRRLEELLADAEFVAALEAARLDPCGAEGLEVAQKLLPVIAVVGRRVPRSNMERASCQAYMYAMVRALGLPSMFLSVSPDDANDVSMLRLSASVRKPGSWPQKMELDELSCEDILSALRGGGPRAAADGGVEGVEGAAKERAALAGTVAERMEKHEYEFPLTQSVRSCPAATA